MIYKSIKRTMDITFSLAAAIILLPVFLLLSLVVYFGMGPPVIFRQKRPGLHEKIFVMYKFRTMKDIKDANGVLLPDAQRLTLLGRFLRSTSLDELPGFLNVIKGEMSLVGPRPLLPAYLSRYTTDQKRRHEVKPGITGWAQVNGRNAVAWEERLVLDVWYVDNRSILLDIRIMLLTLCQIFKRRGISARGHATMPEFKGKEDQDFGA